MGFFIVVTSNSDCWRQERKACSNILLKHEKCFVTDLNRPEPPEKTELAQALPVNGLCVCRPVVELALT